MLVPPSRIFFPVPSTYLCLPTQSFNPSLTVSFRGKPSLILNIPTPSPCHCALPLHSLTGLTVVSIPPSVLGGPAGYQHALRQEALSLCVGPVNE